MKKPTKLLLSFFLLILSIKSEISLNFSEAQNDIKTYLDRNYLHFEIKERKENIENLKYKFYKNKMTKTTHAFDVSFESAENDFLLKFENSEKKNVFNKIRKYYKTEMFLQWNVIDQFMFEIGNLENLKKNNFLENQNSSQIEISENDVNLLEENIFLNLISDLKNEILEINNFLHFKSDFSKKEAILELFSNENLLAEFKIDIHSEKKLEQKNKNKVRFYMLVNIQFFTEGYETIENLEIDMITHNTNHLSLKLASVKEILDYDNFVNNTEEIIEILELGIKTLGITVEDKNVVIEENQKINYNLVFDSEKKSGEINYVQNKKKQANFGLRIFEGEKNLIKFNFGRIKKEDLYELIKKNEFDKIFKNIYDKIVKLFKENFEKTHRIKFSDLIFKSFQNEKMNINNQKGIFGVEKIDDKIFELIYNENNGKVFIEVNFVKENAVFKEDFVKADFNSAVIEEFFVYVLESHLVLMKGNDVKEVVIMF